MKATLPLILIAALGLAACDETMSCGGDAASEPMADTSGTPMPAGLTRDEQTIWNSLSDTAKAQAAEFIANGGTLTQFVAV